MSNVALPIHDYGYAYVNGSTGAAFIKSPNVTVSRNATGVYSIMINDPLVPVALPTVTLIKSGGAGADESYSLDVAPIADTTNKLMVLSTFAGSSAADLNFQIVIRTVGVNAFESAPVY